MKLINWIDESCEEGITCERCSSPAVHRLNAAIDHKRTAEYHFFCEKDRDAFLAERPADAVSEVLLTHVSLLRTRKRLAIRRREDGSFDVYALNPGRHLIDTLTETRLGTYFIARNSNPNIGEVIARLHRGATIEGGEIEIAVEADEAVKAA